MSENKDEVKEIVQSIPFEKKRQYVAKHLDAALKQKKLVDTLIAFYNNNLDFSKTAQSLHVHKNTLYYRLKKIREMIGEDPRNFKVAIKLFLALYMRGQQEGKIYDER